MNITRTKKNLPLKRNYFLIYEGSCTEPDYFRGIKRNMSYLGMDECLITLHEIPKLHLDQNETNILNMIDIARDYVMYNVSGTWTVRYLTTVVFEAIISKISWSNSEFGKIRGKNDALLDLRSHIENDLNNTEYVFDGIVTDLQRAIDHLSETIQNLLNCSVKSLDLDLHSKVPICRGDVVCIIHDRDYHEHYFPDEMYENAVSRCGYDEECGLEYRLVITYPKFELWLLMHSTLDFSSINMKKMTNYVDASGKRISKGGPSDYVTTLVKQYLPFIFMNDVTGKHIQDDDFDFILCDNINKAISNSEIDEFTTDVGELKSHPGTQIGALLKDMGIGSSLISK